MAAVALMIAAAGLPRLAAAQDVSDIGAQLDFNLDRQDQLVGPTEERESAERRRAADVAPVLAVDGGTPEPPPTWTHVRSFSIGAPFSYSTNATRASENTEARFHTVPFARFVWTATSPRFALTALVMTQQDEFVDFALADQTALVGQLRAQLVQANRFAPYVSYSPQIAYAGFFRDRIATVHDIGIGMVRRWQLVDNDAGRGTIDFDLAYVRRESDVAAVQQHRPTLKLRFTRAISDRAEWLVEQTVQPRFFTADPNDGRFDVNLKTQLTVNWNPEGLEPLRLSGTLAVELNESDRPGSDYTLFDIGPSVSATWTF